MLILLPPSEGKAAPRRGRPLDLASMSFPGLHGHRAVVLDALRALCTTNQPALAAELLGLGSTQTGEVARNAHLLEAPTARADSVYRGVLYEALDVASLSAPARRRAARWLAVTSGLFGLLRPVDRIPAYRLSGEVPLPGIGTVSSYWARRLDRAVREAAGPGLVVDLRSSTYASFWRPGADVVGRVATVRVLHEVHGARRVVSHVNKATKGRLVRTLLEDGGAPRTPSGFADHLGALGWKVEQPDLDRHGTRLDVVVNEL
ncbi:MAG TPA: peroxide stress protein YaaA [Nocardioidaceae bacterium]|jgi:cytoplasmic iron level regulating protein YaaA (DUF328/UPF0246 family)|nr:peroxide stress protein YaaA [Nocardioidaceae bacterium]